MQSQIKKIGIFPLHPFLYPGGVKNHVLELKKYLKEKGYECKIGVPRGSLTEKYADKDIRLIGTALTIPFNGGYGDLAVCAAPGQLEYWLEREKFDVFHFHNIGFHSWQIMNRTNGVNVLTFHSNLGDVPGGKEVLAMTKELMGKIHGIIGVSKVALAHFKDFKGPKIVIPNGIDVKKFNPKTKKLKKFLDGKINILFMGRLQERKGPMEMLRAYQIVQNSRDNVRLIMCGDGEQRAECEKFVADNKLKNVVFEGRVLEKDAPNYYATCDIYCSPAVFGESFGIVLLEGMASKKPVIAYNINGYREVLAKHPREFMVKCRDFQALGRRLGELADSSTKRERLAQIGYQIAQDYAWERVTDRILAFYEECAKHKEELTKS